VPYFWFGFHVSQLEFLKTAELPYVCLGCSSAETHSVVQKKIGSYVLRLLGGKDGPDPTEFNIGPAAVQTGA
jgi:hypothetical protein